MNEKKKIETGGPAFPTLAVVADVALSEGGLTVRDYFAAKAMQGELSAQNEENGFYPDKLSNLLVLAKRSYSIADAMIEARKGGAK